MAIGTTAAILGASALGAAGSIASNKAQSSAAKSAANASQQATDASIAEQRRQFDIAQQNQQPWLATGTSALNQLASLYGLQTGAAPQAGTGQGVYSQYTQPYTPSNPYATKSVAQPDATGYDGTYYNYMGAAPIASAAQVSATPVASGMAGFFTSPDYQFRQNEQMRALNARNASLGIQDSGAAQKAALQYSGNLASGEFNNYANRLASLAGVGQTAASTSAQLGQNFANNFSNLQGQNAQNLASSYQNRANASQSMYGDLSNIGGNLFGFFR